MKVKFLYMAVVGGIGGLFTMAFGGWSTGLVTVIMLMCFDLLTGGFIIPVVFKRSPKTETGGIQSNAFGKGVCRKLYKILLISVAYRLDVMFGINYLKDTFIIAFTFEETLSLVENAALMGMPLPAVITNTLDVLKNKKISLGKE